MLEALQIIGLDDRELIAGIVGRLASSGLNMATGVSVWAEFRADRCAVQDEDRQVSYGELARRIRAIGAGLARRGVAPGSTVGLLCRNHAYLVESLCSALQTGSDVVLLNTAFAAPQLRAVIEREGVGTLIHDEDLEPLLEGLPEETPRLLAWHRAAEGRRTLEELTREDPGDWTPHDPMGQAIILTSGTTGTPKGARQRKTDTRRSPRGSQIDTLRRLGLRSGDTKLIASPLFHAWGANMLMSGMLLGETIVLERHFDPERTLATLERTGAHVLAAVPVMLQRILALDPERRKRYRTDTLRSVIVSGSALSASLAGAWMDAFGENLHNLYGSTEAGSIAVANPADLRDAPGTAGRSPAHTELRILDESGQPLPQGQTGRIFALTGMQFDEYTGGGSKQIIDGFMCTGDLGYQDTAGRLFVVGREDEMIISGGENVFPSEIESLLAAHPEVQEVAIVGVPDDAFGQRLRAYVVRRDESSLTEEAIRDHVRSHLARYKVPRDVVFLDELPRNPAGKILKRLLVGS